MIFCSRKTHWNNKPQSERAFPFRPFSSARFDRAIPLCPTGRSMEVPQAITWKYQGLGMSRLQPLWVGWWWRMSALLRLEDEVKLPVLTSRKSKRSTEWGLYKPTFAPSGRVNEDERDTPYPEQTVEVETSDVAFERDVICGFCPVVTIWYHEVTAIYRGWKRREN